MITNVSLITVYCTDQDAARDFYVDRLGFEVRDDITMGEGFRWVTVGHPSQPELDVTLMVPGPPLEPADRPYGVEAIIRDNSGNWLVLVEPKDYKPENFA